MVASSTTEAQSKSDGAVDSQGGRFEKESVGNSAYLNRHNTQMFEAGRSFSGNERNRVWFNSRGTGHADLSDLSGADSANDGRGVLATDFDDDGDVDIFVHNLQRERHSLYRNDLGSSGGFLKVRLLATEGNAEAIGATVTLEVAGRKVAQVLSRGAGFVSCQAPELIFGFGGASSGQLSVLWPSGRTEAFGEVKANSRLWLEEGLGQGKSFDAMTTRLPDPLPRGFRVNVGDRLPKLAVLDSKGEETLIDPVELAGGRELYLNFWATYCVSCVAELPQLEELDGGDQVNVVALSMDAPADLYRAHELLEKRGVTFPGYYLGSKQSGENGVKTIQEIIDLERLPIPSTLVLDAQGVIQRIITGPIE